MNANIENIEFSKEILANLKTISAKFPRKVTIMHVCGTHEYTIAKNGIRSLLPDNIEVISGPGCPVCVCPTVDLDLAIELSKRKDTIITSFGDMMRVPSSTISLHEAKAMGYDVRVVYGPHDAIELAKSNPDKEVIFFAIGFETTAPLIAFEISEKPPTNFSIITAYKTVPPAMDVLLGLEDIAIDGFILPGHVCAIIGSDPFIPYAEKYHSPMIVSGFEVNDMLISILGILQQLLEHRAEVENTYTRIVKAEGNLAAKKFMKQIFEECDSVWRGIGMIPKSGLQLREEFQQYDAVRKFGIKLPGDAKMPPGCSCHLVLIGKIPPKKCPLFGKSCTPQKPVGPCMVSHEGSCKIAYTFRDI
ncbi:hypothetical protein NEF87_001625 [Candidatus Lokiarchaeum ossiferum]|uniref:Hydrogenase formation protein HypD n=1 Tax=Candidatus Lokiarchaeum ossiferum TaxID=2951803 RepID=A0ABY6HP91_9ARCH|nr:hypothetical protein NEF87_001625 [Candidatus Lokiarchaeum sp. B-35]